MAATRHAASYVWPYQMHGSIGPSCALADVRSDGATVWSGTQNPHDIRADLVKLIALPADRIRIVRMEAAGCYGRNCADDVTADAAVLSKAVGRPGPRPVDAPARAWLGAERRRPAHGRGGRTRQDWPTRRLRLQYALSIKRRAHTCPAADRHNRSDAACLRHGRSDRDSALYHRSSEDRRKRTHAPIVRAAWLRGVSALPNVFAHKSFMDELAAAAKRDPVALRLSNLSDPRGVAVLKAVAERAGWDPRPSPNPNAGSGNVVSGRGVAYARYFHSKFPGFGAAWAAWVVHVTVDRATGKIRIKKVTVAHDCGLIVNPNGVRHQIHGNVIQATSRVIEGSGDIRSLLGAGAGMGRLSDNHVSRGAGDQRRHAVAAGPATAGCWQIGIRAERGRDCQCDFR